MVHGAVENSIVSGDCIGLISSMMDVQTLGQWRELHTVSSFSTCPWESDRSRTPRGFEPATPTSAVSTESEDGSVNFWRCRIV